MSFFKDRISQGLKAKYAKLFFPCVVGGVSLLVIRHYIVVGSLRETRAKAKGRTVIITGPTSGIGSQIALKFVKKGARVILACKDETKGNAFRKELILNSGNKEVSVRRLDLASLTSIRQFVDVIVASEPQVNILINNAAVMTDTHSKDKELTADGFERQIGVNYLGHFLLTCLLLDKLKSSPDPHIINVTCSAQQKGRIDVNDFNHDQQPFQPMQAYRDSKLAVTLFNMCLARKLAGSVRVNCVNPGVTMTSLDRNMTYHNSYISSFFMAPLRKVLLKHPKQAAVPVVNLALSREYLDTSGAMMTQNGLQAHGVTPVLEDEDTVKERLWLLSEKWTRLS